MEKELNLYQKIKPIEEKIKKAKNSLSSLNNSNCNHRNPYYWERKIQGYEKEIEEIIKNHGK